MGNSLGKQPAESGVCDHLQGSKAFCLCSPRMCCLLLIVRVPCSYLVSFLFCFVFFFVSFLVSSSRILTFFGRHWISFMFCLFLAGFRLSLVFGFVLFYVFLFFYRPVYSSLSLDISFYLSYRLALSILPFFSHISQILRHSSPPLYIIIFPIFPYSL